jgi:MFS family permease
MADPPNPSPSLETAPDAPRPDRRPAFRLLFACLLVVGAGNTMLVSAVLPPLTRALGLPDWAAGAMFSLSAVLWVITSPIWARASDKFGRRPLVAFGLVAYATSMAMTALIGALALGGHISNIWAVIAGLLVARAIFGLGGSATTPAAQAYVADRTSRAERTSEIASLNAAFGFGLAGGPVVAGALVTALGLLSPLVASAAIALVCAWAVWTRLPETRPPQAEAGPARTRWALVNDPRLRPYLIYGVALSVVTGVLSQTFPFRVMDQLGVSGTQAAQFVTATVTVGALAQLVVQLGVIPRLTASPAQLMASGAGLVALGSLGTVFAADLASLSVCQLVSGVGFGLCRPGYAGGASLAVGAQDQGGVAGLVVAANGAGFVVSPIFGLWLYGALSPEAPFWLLTAILTGMAVYARARAR